jgi:hypothetical protein
VVHAIRVQGSLAVDGRLDEEAWLRAPVMNGFTQFQPEEGARASEDTELRVLYDDQALYIGARLRDSEPARIVRRLSRRDLVADADTFAIYLDPRHDHLTGVQFQVSAGGVQKDALIYDDTWLDDSWDAVWESAVTVDDEGWSVEMRIPFSQLRFAVAPHHVWGINARRVVHRKNEDSWLVMIPSHEHGLASRMAHLHGLAGVRSPRGLDVLPYVSTRAEYVTPSHPDDPFNSGSRYAGGIGMDLKYRLGGTFTVDAAINPDFGQVEVDPAVVNLSAQETFFEEKRPFFIEGNQAFTNFGRSGANSYWGFFRTEPDLFYSRRIGRAPQGRAEAAFIDQPIATTILGAAKITGKTSSGWTFGAIEAVTGRESARTMADAGRGRTPVEPLTNYAVIRAQRDLGRRGGMGVLTTTVHRDLGVPALRDLLVGQAYVAGADGHVFFDRSRDWVLTGGVAGSLLKGSPSAIVHVQQASLRYFQRPDATHVRLDRAAESLSGWTGHLDLNKNSGNVVVNAAVWGISPGFDANDLGFMYQADRAGGHGLVQWRKLTPDRFTRQRSVAVAKWWTWNYGGDSQGDGVQVLSTYQFLNYWRLTGNAGHARRTWDDRLTRGGPTTIRPGNRFVNVSFGSDPRRTVSLSGYGTYTAREFGGRTRSAQLAMVLKPMSSLTLSTGPTVMRLRQVAQYIRSVPDPLAAHTFGTRYIFGTLEQTEVSMTTRMNLILSPKLSLQVYAQPLISVGDYPEYKELAQPRTYDFLRYGVEKGTLDRDAQTGRILIDPDGEGPAAPFGLPAADFNFKSLRVNAVLRWEWGPGSTVFFVWTQRREDLADPGHFAFGRDARALFGAPADDILMVKVTYWFSR